MLCLTLADQHQRQECTPHAVWLCLILSRVFSPTPLRSCRIDFALRKIKCCLILYDGLSEAPGQINLSLKRLKSFGVLTIFSARDC